MARPFFWLAPRGSHSSTLRSQRDDGQSKSAALLTVVYLYTYFLTRAVWDPNDSRGKVSSLRLCVEKLAVRGVRIGSIDPLTSWCHSAHKTESVYSMYQVQYKLYIRRTVYTSITVHVP